MSDHSLPKVGASFQTAGSAINPGTGRSVYITAIINGTDAVISDGVTPKAGVTVGYFIGRATRTTGN